MQNNLKYSYNIFIAFIIKLRQFICFIIKFWEFWGHKFFLKSLQSWENFGIILKVLSFENFEKGEFLKKLNYYETDFTLNFRWLPFS